MLIKLQLGYPLKLFKDVGDRLGEQIWILMILAVSNAGF
jgi:hypothetical protein